jgi:hypothetical protein
VPVPAAPLPPACGVVQVALVLPWRQQRHLDHRRA